MAKRFTDTEKWDKQWFRKLPLKHKLLWMYICDRCDVAGVWEIDWETAGYFIGEPIDEAEALRVFAGKVEKIDGGEKLWLPSFIAFQYGERLGKSPLHKKITGIIKKYGLRVSIGYGKGIDTHMVKETEEEAVTDTDKEKEKAVGSPPVILTDNEDLSHAFYQRAGRRPTQIEVHGMLQLRRKHPDKFKKAFDQIPPNCRNGTQYLTAILEPDKHAEEKQRRASEDIATDLARIKAFDERKAKALGKS